MEARLDEFVGRCSTCGYAGTFRLTQHRIRETFACDKCSSSARYQVQSHAIIQAIFGEVRLSLRDAAEQGFLDNLRIYEVGLTGPYRKYLEKLPGYTKSFYWPDVVPGERRDNVVCQDLMRLTYGNCSFDLVITSDILEHVRHPDVAFGEISRILVQGGRHIFTVPTNVPFAKPTVKRVDVSDREDAHILMAAYHGDGKGGRSLVYNEFGSDLLGVIDQYGMKTKTVAHEAGGIISASCIAFISEKL